jgi:hypothetical protein
MCAGRRLREYRAAPPHVGVRGAPCAAACWVRLRPRRWPLVAAGGGTSWLAAVGVLGGWWRRVTRRGGGRGDRQRGGSGWGRMGVWGNK